MGGVKRGSDGSFADACHLGDGPVIEVGVVAKEESDSLSFGQRRYRRANIDKHLRIGRQVAGGLGNVCQSLRWSQSIVPLTRESALLTTRESALLTTAVHTQPSSVPRPRN